MPILDDTGDVSKILKAGPAAAVDDGLLTRAWKQLDLSAQPSPSAMAAPLTEMINHIIDYERAGRRVAVGLGLTRLRQHYECLDPEDLPPDEQSWEAFAGKHLPLPQVRIAELIGKMVHHGGLLRCTKCSARTKSECGCGAPYVGEHHWAMPVDKVKPNNKSSKDSALDRALVAITTHPEKSNRALAAEIGCDDKTIAKARRTIGKSAPESAPDVPPDKRVGRDGRSYPAIKSVLSPSRRRGSW